MKFVCVQKYFGLKKGCSKIIAGQISLDGRLPSLKFHILVLFLYPWTRAKYWKTSMNPLCTIFAPFSIR